MTFKKQVSQPRDQQCFCASSGSTWKYVKYCSGLPLGQLEFGSLALQPMQCVTLGKFTVASALVST